MILFITSIRHPKTAKDYQRLLEDYRLTYASLNRQTNKNFKILTVVNRPIRGLGELDNTEQLLVDISPPDILLKDGTIDIEAIREDKALKYAGGLSYGQKWDPDYVMFFDSDDFFSKHIAEVADTEKFPFGAFVDKGYIYRKNSHFIQEYNNLERVNGSTHILRNKDLIRYQKEALHSYDEISIRKSFDKNFLYVIGRHRKIKQFFSEEGYSFVAFPVRAVIYVLGTGENISGNSGVDYGRLLNRKIIEEFSLPRPSGALITQCFSCLKEAAKRVFKKLNRSVLSF